MVEIETSVDLLSDHSNFQDAIESQQITNAIERNLPNESPEVQAKYREQIIETQKEIARQIAENESNLIKSNFNFRTELANKLNLSPEDANFNKIWDEGTTPEVENSLLNQLNETAEQTNSNLDSMKQELGIKDGEPWPKKAFKYLAEKFRETFTKKNLFLDEKTGNLSTMKIFEWSLILSAVLGSVFGITWDKTHKFSRDNKPSSFIGCLRVNTLTGDVDWPPRDKKCGISGTDIGSPCKDDNSSPFCDLLTYPPVPCGITYSICDNKGSGKGQCELGSGENPDDYIYLPVCGDINLLFMAMSFINSDPDTFTPNKTPTFLRVLTIIFIILLILTVVWYIYVDVKKILNKQKI
jgi:hypothetical protein